MITQVVAIKDRALDAFMNPFHAQTLGQAIRSFSDEINRKAQDNNMNQHPEDYDLYHLGAFDNTTGRFTNEEEQPKQIAIGKNCSIARIPGYDL